MFNNLVQLDPACAVPDLMDVHEDAIRNHPRTLQKVIGPSSLGSACDRCLVLELAQQPPEGDTDDAAWLPDLGHAMHEHFERNLLRYMARIDSHRWITEGRVAIGHVGGVLIEGNSDVFDLMSGTVVDYKLVGTKSLTEVRRHGAKTTYIRQGQCYGLGYEQLGYDVRSVAIWFVPRNGLTLRMGEVVQFDYDRQVALETVAHADRLARAIASLGLDVVLAKVGPHTGTEFGCPDPNKDERVAKQLDGLIPTK